MTGVLVLAAIATAIVTPAAPVGAKKGKTPKSESEVASNCPKKDAPDFEQTYRRYEFSELVRIALIVADWIGRTLRKRSTLEWLRWFSANRTGS